MRIMNNIENRGESMSYKHGIVACGMIGVLSLVSGIQADAAVRFGHFKKSPSYVTVMKKDYGIYKDKQLRKKVSTSQHWYHKTLYQKGYYRLSSGKCYVSLYDKNNHWIGYMNQSALKRAKTKGGISFPLNRCVNVNKDNYTLWKDFNFQQKKGNSSSLLHYNVYVGPEYNHLNGETYYSLYTEKNGKWLGYINKKGTTLKLANNDFGSYHRYDHYGTIMKDNYGIYKDKQLKNRVAMSKKYQYQTLYAKGYYQKLNGKRYVSLYDHNNKWIGYMDDRAFEVSKNQGGIGLNVNRVAYVVKSNVPLWKDFDFKQKKGNSRDIYQQKIMIKPEYHHFNGKVYDSIYSVDTNHWLGYIESDAISFNEPTLNDNQKKEWNQWIKQVQDMATYTLYTKESRDELIEQIKISDEIIQKSPTISIANEEYNKIKHQIQALSIDNQNWDLIESKDQIRLRQYRGCEKNIIIPGEINGKSVVLDRLNSYNSFFNTNSRPYIENITFKAVSGHKVKAPNTLRELFLMMKLNSLDLSGLDTSEVSDMSRLFNGSQIKHIQISNIDVSNVKNMDGMFSFTTIGDSTFPNQLKKWKTNSVETMQEMFSYSAIPFTLNLSSWNVEKVTSMEGMFQSSRFKLLDLSGWNLSRLTTLKNTFADCSGLETVCLKSWKTPRLQNIDQLFHACYSLKSLDLSNIDVSNVTSMRASFAYCNTLRELNVANWRTENVKDMYALFMECRLLEKLDISNWNVSKVTMMDNLFNHDVTLKSIDLSHWEVNPKVSHQNVFDDIDVDSVVRFGAQSQILK